MVITCLWIAVFATTPELYAGPLVFDADNVFVMAASCTRCSRT